MLFNSLQFLIFFPLVVSVYFLLPGKHRWALLLAASYYFYMSWEPEYLLLILTSTLVDYIAALQIFTSFGRRRNLWLGASLLVNLGILAFFKYANFFWDSLHSLLGTGIQVASPIHRFLLPVGISFYTFQTLSYSIDVWRGRIEPERHLGRFALFVAFFPQLVAGPIERAAHLLPQFRQNHSVDLKRITSGLRLMLWGMFKKVVLADRLALVVDQVYGNPDEQNGLTWLLATYFFSFQIYCDFSGYSDIAIGSARVLGFDLMKNFNVPYMARSAREFWQRWHISLSTWFRDYVYIPLGGNRSSAPRWFINIIITFVVSGLWHGANWTFVVWGGLHGLYLLAERYTTSWLPRRMPGRNVIETLLTFHLVLLAWVFFRAKSVEIALHIIGSILTDIPGDIIAYLGGANLFLGLGNIPQFMWAGLIPGILLFYVLDAAKDQSYWKIRFANSSGLRLVVYACLFYGILFLGYFGETQFIYFQF